MTLDTPLNLQLSDGKATSNPRGGNSTNGIVNSTGDNTIFWVSMLVVGYMVFTAIKRKK